MNFQEASEIISNNGDYASADFYRMRYATSIALGLHDDPKEILADVVRHGSEPAKELLKTAINTGYVAETDGIYDVIDVEDVSGAPFQFRSHIAMQIAYPDLYIKYYDGEHVWTYSHPKMQDLLQLCVSCLTNRLHPSDYYGQHEIIKLRKPKLVKQSDCHRAWVAACQAHRVAIADAWTVYRQACDKRKEAKKGLETELEPLHEEIAAIKRKYNAKIQDLDDRIKETYKKHSSLKAAPKPLKSAFQQVEDSGDNYTTRCNN